MKNTVVVGLSHKTTPIAIREKFYFNELQQKLLLSELKSECAITEAFLLSTCNRTEIFANVLDVSRDKSVLLSKISELKGISLNDSKEHFYCLEGEAAIRHLFQVACSLDSLVLGEKQILGQLKEAVELSRQRGMMGTRFNILTNLAIRAGKKAQTETEVGVGGMSVSWAAVTLAEEMLTTLQDKKVLLLGAGKMGTLAGDLLRNRGIEKVYVMNRTQENAAQAARQFCGIPVGFWDIKEILSEVDAGICAVDAPHYILEKETIEKVMTLRSAKPLFLIDISIPRNIDPAVAEVPGVTLADIDALEKVVEANKARRTSAIAAVEAIVEAKFKDYKAKLEKNETLREFLEPTGTVE